MERTWTAVEMTRAEAEEALAHRQPAQTVWSIASQAFSQDREQGAIAADQVFAKPTFRSKGSSRRTSFAIKQQELDRLGQGQSPGGVGQLVSPPEQIGAAERVAASCERVVELS